VTGTPHWRGSAPYLWAALIGAAIGLTFAFLPVANAWVPVWAAALDPAQAAAPAAELYRMNADGSGQTRLTISEVDERSPAVSPDGTRVVGSDPEGRPRLYLLDGGASEPVPGVTAGDHILQWTDDGRALFVGHRAGPVWQVRRLDLRTGRATPWTEIAPRMTAGLRLSFVYLTPNGRFWAHSYSRLLSDLYVVEGIR